MTISKEHWTKSAWTIGIGSAIFSLLLTMGYDYSKENPIWTTVLTIIKWTGNLLWTLLNFDIKVWWILVAIIILTSTVAIIIKFSEKETLMPVFGNYRKDRLKRWIWSWDWTWSNGKNAWVITNLQAHCPKCDTPMIYYSSFLDYSYTCPRCEFSSKYDYCEDPDKIERIIFDNIDRKNS